MRLMLQRMIIRHDIQDLIYFLMILTLHGCGGRPVVVPTLPVGIPLQDVCDRYHVTWQWDGVTQVVMMEYRGNKSKALVGSSTVLIGQTTDHFKRAPAP